ncbi:inactive dipeptidyl peptidase 10 isoform X2 [Macrosteles quadrilineatus]|uniref:inactive dipeptidyl peptidase 10 isoform X2 n=1 Tax=Macrosteles quadrilineatus TaxID=74068 RepID=UPI0023E2E30B|nr:inactive dipeptidyl peptidase 10 isoform X2 [Macrosteles quadrilineatus]XP_054285173.1 inactive dipeptidyl peptidase 10 isoform X2 [Macrosteles quadrilineatus]
MHAAIERNSWRLPPEDIVQVADPRSKKAQDLVYPGASEGRNWWSVVLSLLVIGLVIAGILTAIHTLGYVDELLYWSGRRMTLDEYLQGELCPSRLPPAWVSHRHFVFQGDDGGLRVYDARTDIVSTLVSNHTLRQLNVKWFQCSSDLKYILLRHNIKQVFKNSFISHYTIYDVDKDHHIPVRLSDSPKVSQTWLQVARWCGNTTRLVLVSDNDIYIRYSPGSTTDIRLTHTGHPSLIYNGVPDWLYQEDVLTPPHDALWCSPDGSYLLFASFNDSEVRNFNFPWFSLSESAAAENGATFPASRSVRYPTPGSPNPSVKLWLADLNNTKEKYKEVRPPEVFEDQDYYLTSAGWIDDDNQQVAAIWMNRPQNLTIISSCSTPHWQCVEKHSERAEGTWLEVQPHPVFSRDGNSFLLLASVQEGAIDTFTHIKHVTLTQQRIAVISHGHYEVTEILAWDSINHLVYYLGTHERSPGQRHLYVVQDPDTDTPLHLEPQCLTCDLTTYLGARARSTYINCSHFNAYISLMPPDGESPEGMRHYVLLCEGPQLPLAGVHNTTNHQLLRVLFNKKTQCGKKLNQLALPKMRSFEVPLPQGYRAQVQLLLPPSWRQELRDASYPVLVEVNGRPGSQSVSEKFELSWGTYMSSKNDVVYVKLDVRGSRGHGSRTLYRRLGGVEVQDQIHALRYMLEEFKFLDQTRIALWGWGYGGYVTTMVLGSQQKIFKCGIAVSPISDWQYYNSAFTERIMGYPNENVKMYVEADATQRSKHIPSHSIFLIHGLADMTVPYQHSVSLAHSLAKEDIMYRYQSYADQGHDLVGVLPHAYSSMEDYLRECLTLDSDEKQLL